MEKRNIEKNQSQNSSNNVNKDLVTVQSYSDLNRVINSNSQNNNSSNNNANNNQKRQNYDKKK